MEVDQPGSHDCAVGIDHHVPGEVGAHLCDPAIDHEYVSRALAGGVDDSSAPDHQGRCGVAGVR